MEQPTKSPKVLAAEAILNAFLHAPSNVIGSDEEEAVIKLMRTMPPGVDEEKIRAALKKMSTRQFFRFCSSFPKTYIPLLCDMLRTFQLQPHGTYASPMMLGCLQYTAQKVLTDPTAYEGFGEVGKFMQYLSTLQFAIDKPEQFTKSDKLLTPAVSESVVHALTAMELVSEDRQAFNSMMYALGKADSPRAVEAVKMQMGRGGDKLDTLAIMAMALKPHASLPETARAYQLIRERLTAIQAESPAYRFAKALGLEPEFDLKWSVKIETTAANGYMTVEVASNWSDCLQLSLKSTTMKNVEKGNARSGIFVENAYRKIDLQNIRPEMNAIAGLFGIEALDWKKVKISVSGFDKGAAKTVKENLMK